MPVPAKFKLKYAPHFGMFKHLAGSDPLEELRFAVDQGFTAFEDNGMRQRPKDQQEKISAEMRRLHLEMGVFVATGAFDKPTFVSGDEGVQEMVLQDIRESVETAKRVNAKWCTVVPGCFDTRAEWDYQTARAVDLLKRCAEICEKEGLVMVLEPLNAWADHPGLFLTRSPQAYLICKAVGSPSCKILFDIYHQQISEGNLLPNLEKCWEEIAYIQIGDNPGRCEPGSGEINYKNVFRQIHYKGYEGILGMEHGKSKPGTEGEKKTLEAYRICDDFIPGSAPASAIW